METEDEWPPAYPHRGWEKDARRLKAHNDLIAMHLETLAKLERETRPADGAGAAERKDFKAFEALSVAMDLVECVAGWAIDHQIGLAAAGLQFVPLQPSGTKTHPDYLKQLEAVDSHEHERAGSRYNSEAWPDTADFRRLALVNVLRTMHTNSLHEFTHEAAEALQALEYGERLPLLKPNLTGKKAKYRALLLQLKAVGIIEFRSETGTRKKVAQEMVAAAYGVGPDAVRNWEYRLRKESGLGDLRVSRELSFAQNAASHVLAARRGEGAFGRAAERHLARYGDDALADAGAQFKSLPLESKN